MVKVKFNPKKFELKVKGHAGAGDLGKDLICASVSTLTLTLAKSLDNCQDMLCKGLGKAVLSEGDALIRVKPKVAYEANISLIYWTCLNGFKMLADEYPEYVKMDVIGE